MSAKTLGSVFTTTKVSTRKWYTHYLIYSIWFTKIETNLFQYLCISIFVQGFELYGYSWVSPKPSKFQNTHLYEAPDLLRSTPLPSMYDHQSWFVNFIRLSRLIGPIFGGLVVGPVPFLSDTVALLCFPDAMHWTTFHRDVSALERVVTIDWLPLKCEPN